MSHAYLASTFTADLATETTADTNYVTALNAATSGITQEEQKLTLDNNTIQKIGFGQDCDAADASTYSSCVTSEDQTAAYARSDAAAVEADVQTDFQRYASSASTYRSALGTFIGQMLGLPWPSGYDKDVNATVTAARAFRTDVALQEAVLASDPSVERLCDRQAGAHRRRELDRRHQGAPGSASGTAAGRADRAPRCRPRNRFRVGMNVPMTSPWRQAFDQSIPRPDDEFDRPHDRLG